MKVAAYVRPWSINYFKYFLPKVFPEAETLFLSDFRGLGDYQWSERFHGVYNKKLEGSCPPYWLDIKTEFEIIIRDRLLRSMPFLEASRMVRAMSRSIQIMLDEVMPNAIVSPSADSYVMDLLIQHCNARGIHYCGILPCPFPKYTRVTTIGERTSFRTPSDHECATAVAAVKDQSFHPVDLIEWLKMYGKANVRLKRSLREVPKQYIFPIIGKLRKDPKNYHYLGSALSSVSFFTQAVFSDRFFKKDWQHALESWRGTKVYIPLQTYPECTTDYHVRELDLIDFPRLLPRLLDALCQNNNILVCVKEHPGMMGARPPGFYDEILRRKNLLLISGEVSASQLIESTDLIVTWTGTGALEGVLRGKPAITMGVPFYSTGQMFRSIRSLEELDRVAELVEETRKLTHTPENDVEVARHILSGTFPGEFRFINFNQDNELQRKDADVLAVGMREYWDAWCTSKKSL